MALRPLAVHHLAQDVLACVCAALNETAADVEDAAGCPCRACVVPGTPSWEDCADPCSGETGGQLTVHVRGMWPSSSFPSEDREVRGLRGCLPSAATAVELVVTLLRCAPVGTEDGCPPECIEWEEVARQVHLDATSVFNALMCCLPATAPGRRGRRFVLGRQRTIGPQGGCVGIEQPVTVALPGCAPCPQEV